MKVICIDDTKLPDGAEVVKGKEYIVLEKFVNFADQTAYIIEGIRNKGTGKYGLPWLGYAATRFSVVDSVEETEEMVEEMLN
jgi:hypothetical protein